MYGLNVNKSKLNVIDQSTIPNIRTKRHSKRLTLFIWRSRHFQLKWIEKCLVFIVTVRKTSKTIRIRDAAKLFLVLSSS